MKKINWLLLSFLVLCMTGCGSTAKLIAEKDTANLITSIPTSDPLTDATTEPTKEAASETISEPTSEPTVEPAGEVNMEPTVEPTSEATIEGKEEKEVKIKVGQTSLSVTLASNSSADALKELLKKGPITINMRDYASMEKVGGLGTSLPTNDEQITTEAGDVILYQGSALVIYYDTNSWNFTRLGKIEGVTQKELKEILGTGDITITLSLE